MTDAQAERIIALLEEISASLAPAPSPPMSPYMPWLPSPKWSLPNPPVDPDCGCPLLSVCGNVNCPRRPKITAQLCEGPQ
jgi:hypothetical protein